MMRAKRTKPIDEPLGRVLTAESERTRRAILDGIAELKAMTAERALQLTGEGVVFTQDGFRAWRQIGQNTLYETHKDLRRQVGTLCRGIRHRFKAVLKGQATATTKEKSIGIPSEAATETIRKLRKKIKTLEILLSRQEEDFIQLQYRFNELFEASRD